MIQIGSKFRLITNTPVAVESPDHKYPFGVKENNNHSQGFTDKLHELYPRPLSLLDLGTAGGHNIWQHNLQGDNAVGLEGSDYRKVRGLPEWNIESNLFTCDVTKSFQLQDNIDGEWKDSLLDVITAWELIEHIHKNDLEQFYTNVREKLKPNGAFIVSICVFDDEKATKTRGVEWGPSDEFPDGNMKSGPWRDQPLFYHQYICSREDRYKEVEEHGFKINWEKLAHFEGQFVRGPGIGCSFEDTINLYMELL